MSYRLPLSIFALPKPFKGHIGLIQENAIESWCNLVPRPEILLFGDEHGTREMARQFNTIHIPDIARNPQGTPLLNQLFADSVESATGGCLAYVNSDIILTQSFITALSLVKSRKFLMCGQRCNLDINFKIDFGQNDWETDLRAIASRDGKLEGPQALDYFVFSRGVFRQIPPFALGRTAWDNWLLFEALRRGADLIDATNYVLAIHQNHDYAHLPGGKEEVFNGPEAKENLRLSGGKRIIPMTLDLAKYNLTAQGQYLRKRVGWEFDVYARDILLVKPHLKLWLKLLKLQFIMWRKAVPVLARLNNLWDQAFAYVFHRYHLLRTRWQEIRQTTDSH